MRYFLQTFSPTLAENSSKVPHTPNKSNNHSFLTFATLQQRIFNMFVCSMTIKRELKNGECSEFSILTTDFSSDEGNWTNRDQ